MNFLFIGDVVGKGGRSAVKSLAPELRREFNCQFCVVNVENIANGGGMNAKTLNQLLPDYADVATSGDHVWDQKALETEIHGFDNVLRPANMGENQPGRGYGVFRNAGGGDIAVVNLMGQVFMRPSARCPFEKVREILSAIPKNVKCILVDFHAEATSEKAAMARFLDGRVTAVLGTHTHVQTADATILPGGTAFISDVGMVGAERSVLGRCPDSVVDKFVSGMPRRLPVVEKGDIRLDAVVVSYNHNTGKATAIQPISRTISVGLAQ